MPTAPKLVLDTFCEVYGLLKPWAEDEFWDLQQHSVVPDATYVIGRQQYLANKTLVRELAESGHVQIVMSNPHEGSETLVGQLTHLGLLDLAQHRKIKIIGGGDMAPEWPYMRYDKFLPEILDYEENLAAATRCEEIYNNHRKPYQFLFLNGRQRSHRKYLLERLDIDGTLKHALWTTLDAKPGPSRNIKLFHNGVDMMRTVRPAKTLPAEYEVDKYRSTVNPQSDHAYVKFDLFQDQWGEIYLEPAPYIDTYFSLVTETVFEYPYSFRTEKIWKPIVMGHPWIAAANRGFYRDMHNLGFQTYGHVIDESFDQIDNNQDRIQRIASVVNDLVAQDLVAFLKECYNTSKYNQQHHRELAVKTRQEFPDRFFQFINE